MGSVKFYARQVWKTKTFNWNLDETACVVIDMWDKHWCKGATKRVGELIPPMNKFLDFLRKNGLKTVAFCPTSVADSDTHKNSIPRKRAKEYSNDKIEFKRDASIPDITTWIDPYTVQCDCDTKCARGKPWTRQNSKLVIDDKKDMIFDEQEYYIFHALEKLNIKNLFFLGVHANMCMIYRRFGMKNFNSMEKYNIVLLRDLTDSMTPKEERPHTDHFDGLDATVDFVESCFAYSASSKEIMGESDTYYFDPLFKDDVRSRYILVSDSDKYRKVTFNHKINNHISPPTMLSIGYDESNLAITGVELISTSTQETSVKYESSDSGICYSLDDPGEYINMASIGYAVYDNNTYVIKEVLFKTNYNKSFEHKCKTGGYHIRYVEYKCPKGMAFDSFFGIKNDGRLNSLGVNNTHIQYICATQGNATNYVKYLDNNKKRKIFELWGSRFYVYEEEKRQGGTIYRELQYVTTDWTAWSSFIDGVVFKHKYANTLYHQSASIALKNHKNENICIYKSDGNSNIYVPKDFRGDHPPNINHPYYIHNIIGIFKKTDWVYTHASDSQNFDDYAAYMSKKSTYPKAIFYKKGDLLDSIGIEYNNGEKMKHGGNGGCSPEYFELEKGEFITKMDIRHLESSFICDVKFYTNKGRVHSINPKASSVYKSTIDFKGRGLAFFYGASAPLYGDKPTNHCMTGLGAYTIPII